MLGALVAGLLGVSLVMAARVWGPWIDPARLYSSAQAALERGEYDLAEKLASRISARDERWPRAQLIAGQAAIKKGRFEDAAGYFAAVPRDGSRESLLAVYSLGEVQRERGHVSEALECYRYVLENQPDHASTHQRLAMLLALTGQRWQARPHFMFLVRQRAWTIDSLVLLGDLERPVEEKVYLERCLKKARDDVLVQLAAGHLAMAEGRPAEARRRLTDVIQRAPEIVSAHAMLGELLVDAEERAFLDWHARLPPQADEDPDVWFVRGRWARRQGELDVAVRCFWETVRRMPLHRRGHYQLGQALNQLGQTQQAEPFLERARLQFALTQALDQTLRSRGRDRAALRQVAELMDQSGRPWEAWAWGMTAGHMFPETHWPRQLVSRLRPQLSEATPQILDSARLALRHDFSALPDHRSLLAGRRANSSRPQVDDVSATIRFEDLAESVGLDFIYHNGHDPATMGARMFESNGGGVAVLDYALDGWPDLYFTQGTEWPSGSSEPRPTPALADRLYRNLGGEQFVDVTAETGLGDLGFGQGVSAGDFNNDGFPDLYVANIGRNRLYRNNGDGTFSDVASESGLLGDDWTTSCLIADLDGDGIPDLYDVNYAEGEDVYQRICQWKACSPKVFPDARDRFFRGAGDGTFDFVDGATPEAGGKGLGLVAARIGEQEKASVADSLRESELDSRSESSTNSAALSLFIANDQVPNFFLRPRWVNHDAAEPAGGHRSPGGPLRLVLEDRAFITGLAYDGNGLPLACMGVAADDANGNGLLDFFVTNFKDEPNTLYLQDAPELFVDATGPAGLDAPSFPYVGWGTQFLDADRDGRPDLVVVNGHVDDYRDEGAEYHMRPQFFRNSGGGRFRELQAEAIGDYFGREFLGRGLARLDWNRDGRMDFVVSNIGQRVSLVTNRSTAIGHFLNVRLHATATARDAIGATVEVETHQDRWSKQLVAGDGYMATNERMLQFGLGEAASVKELRVHWPSRATAVFRDLPVNVTVELVEGAPRLIQWRDSHQSSPVMP